MKRLPYGRSLLSRVAARWRKQYYDGVNWKNPLNTDAEDVYRRLRAVNPTTASARDIAEIIGNETWVGHFCSECFEYKEHAIEFGDNSVTLCCDCIRDAASMLAVKDAAIGVEP